MKNLRFIGGIIGLLCNIPIIIGISQGTIEQSFSTWILWGILDGITATTIILQRGNFWLPLGYSIGATSVAIVLAINRQFSWGLLDTFTAVLVILCLVVWFLVGTKAATIAGVSALTVASIPQIVETFYVPATTPTTIYLVFCVANLLSLIGGKKWSVEEKLYPGAALILCVLLTILSIEW